MSNAVRAAIRAIFPAPACERIVALIETYGVEDYERERERVQLAIVKLSGGSEERLAYYVAVAKQDYRDVLLWADNPPAAAVDTPKKRHEIRELLKKMGVEPPDSLKD